MFLLTILLFLNGYIRMFKKKIPKWTNLGTEGKQSAKAQGAKTNPDERLVTNKGKAGK